jgi:hypothetical protein
MGKAFRDYIGASSYAIGDLATSHEIEVALKQLQDLGSQPLDHTNDPGHPDYISGAEQRMVGSIRKEISKRRQEQARDRNVGQMERALGTVGFLNFLGAPSYWLLNMTQNVTVGVPTLATTSGKTYTQAAAGLVSSMKVLMKAAGEGGLVSKGKNIYNIEEFIKGLPEKYGALIKHLIDENAIGSTIAQEFGNTLSDFALAKQPVVKTVMGVLQGAPQAVEYFNRMAMAMAAYDLTTGTEEAKRLAAQDAVERAHFNYSPANRARLLKTLPSFLGGGGEAVVRPIMMFKVYGVNMMRLVYGSAYDAVKGDTPETRAAARKMLFGLLASHTLVGGIYGGLGLGAVEIAGAAINAILGPDDKIDWGYEMDRWLSEVTNDYVARVVTRGLPVALGADMSQSANLGNLLFMLPGRADPAAPGGAEQIGFSLLGPMAEYGASTVRTASKYIEDGHGLGDLLSTVGKMAPLKMVRELTNTVEMAGGLETANGQSFMDASEVPITSLLMKGLLGLRPAIVTQRQDRFYSDRAYTVAMENRKSRLEAAALGAKSESDAQRAQDAIQEFNKVQYQKGNTTLVINPDDLQRAAKSRMSVSRRYAAGQYTQYNR